MLGLGGVLLDVAGSPGGSRLTLIECSMGQLSLKKGT